MGNTQQNHPAQFRSAVQAGELSDGHAGEIDDHVGSQAAGCFLDFAAASSFLELITTSAPTFLACSSFSSQISTAMILPAFLIFAYCYGEQSDRAGLVNAHGLPLLELGPCHRVQGVGAGIHRAPSS